MVPSVGATEKIPSDTTGNRSRALTTTLPQALEFAYTYVYFSWERF